MAIPSPQSYLDLAQNLLAQGQISDAFNYVQKALEIDPKFAPALLEMGKILEQNGQLDDSLDCYAEALKIDPDLWEAHWLTGIIYDRKGLQALALQSFQAVMAAKPDLFPPAEHLKLAKVFLQQQNPQAAIRSTQLCSPLPEAWQVCAQAQIMLEQIDAAASSLLQAQALDPMVNLAAEYASLGKLALKHHQIDRGQTFLQTALAMQPDLSDAHFYLALSFLALGQLREALFSFQELVSINPNYAPAYYEMGILAAKLSQWEAADAFFSAGRTLNPHIYPQVQPLIDRAQDIQQRRSN